MTTEAYLQQELGITIDQAREFILSNFLTNLQSVYDLCIDNSITNSMIAEILSIGGITSQTILEFFNSNGFDGDALDINNPLVEENNGISLTITDNKSSAIGAEDIKFTFKFSSPVSGFDLADISVSGGIKGKFTKINLSEYILVVTPRDNFVGNISVSVNENIAFDLFGTGNSAGYHTQLVDTLAPRVTISQNSSEVTAEGNYSYSIYFSENVSELTLADIDVTNGTKVGLNKISDARYTLEVAPIVNNAGNIIVDIGSDVVRDSAGNWNNGTTANFTILEDIANPADTTSPTLTITDNHDTVATGDILYTFIFSEAVSGFDADDITLSHGTKGVFTSVDETTYTLVVTPPDDYDGEISVDVAAEAAIDSSYNGNHAATTHIQAVDTLNATLHNVTIASNNTDTTQAKSGDIVTLTFSADDTLTQDPVVTIAGKSATVTASGLNYSATITLDGSETEGTVAFTIDYLDEHGNPGPQVTSVNGTGAGTSVRTDFSKPTLTITDDHDGTTATGDILYTFSFSEEVSGFTSEDITLLAGTKGVFTTISASEYTLAVTPPANYDGDITVDVNGDVATDIAGNTNNTALTNTQAVKTVLPTLIITDDHDGTTANGDITYTFTFSETVIGFTIDDITLSAGIKGAFSEIAPNDGTTYTLVVTPPANTEGNITVDVNADVATDSSGNGNTAATTNTQAVDTQASTANLISITDDVGNITGVLSNGDTTDDTALVLFGTCEAGSSVEVFNGTSSLGDATVTDTTWSFSATVVDGTTYQFNVKETDASGNESDATTDFTIIGDTTAPTATLTSTTITNSENTVVQSSETGEAYLVKDSVTVNLLSDITSANDNEWNQTTIAAADTNTNLAATGLIDGTYNLYTIDSAGNLSAVSNNSVTIDSTQSSLTITDDHDGTTANGDILYTFIFSEDVTGFTSEDIDISAGTKGSFSTVSASEYTLVVTPPVDMEGNITVDVDANVATDGSGNANAAATTNTQAVDTIVPTLSITDDHPSTAIGDILYSFSFSENVTGFTADDVTLSLGTKGVFTAVSANQYTLAVTPPANTEGDITVDVNANVATDLAGNANTAAATNTQTVDTIVPTVTITDDHDGTTATGDILYTFTFSEVVTGFTSDDITLSSGTKGTFTALSASEYTLVVTPPVNTEGNLTVDLNANIATDSSGNGNSAPTTNTQAVDTSVPTVTITDDHDGTTANGAILYRFTFSENVTGFISDEIDISAGTKGTFTAVSASEYTLVVTPPADTEGDITVDVDADVATDDSGNGNSAAATNTQSIDTVAPNCTDIVFTDTALSVGESTSVTFTFSEAVSGFTTADVTVANGAIDDPVTADNGITWTATYTPTEDTEDTTNVITVADTGIVDGVGNSGEGTTSSANYEVDTLTPTLSSVSIVSDNADTTQSKSGDTITLTFTASETLLADPVVTIFEESASIDASSAPTYTATLLLSGDEADGVVPFTIDFTDSAGNGGVRVTQTTNGTSVTNDNNVPALTVTDDHDGTTATGDILYSFTFSEDVTGFSADDIDISAGTKGIFSTLSAQGYTLVVTPPVDTEGNITVDVDADVVIDGSNNGNSAATTNTQAVDTLAPTLSNVTIASNNTDTTQAKSADIITLTFSASETLQANPTVTIAGEDATVLDLGSNNYSASYTLSGSESAGDTTFAIDFIDSVGNNGTTVDAVSGTGTGTAVNIDFIAPTATLTTATIPNTSNAIVQSTETGIAYLVKDTVVDMAAANDNEWNQVDIIAANTNTDLAATGLIDGTYQLYTTDAAGNLSAVSTNSVTIDSTVPTLTITDDHDGTVATGDITYTFTFSETVTGFSIDDITLSAGTKGAFNEIAPNDGTTYTLVVTPPADTEGDITVDVDANVATDSANNANTAAITNTQTVDTIAPNQSNVNNALGTIATSSSPGVEEIDSGYRWDSSKTTITYSFLDSIPDSYTDYGNKLTTGWTAFSDTQKDIGRDIMDQIDALLEVDLVEAAAQDGDIRLSLVDQDGSAAFAFYPVENPDYGGDIFLSTEFNNPDATSDYTVSQGGYGWATIVHELGHTFGLEHPFDTPADQAGEAPHLDSDHDNHLYSLMSYTAKYNYKPVFTLNDDNSIGFTTEGTYPTLYSIYDLNILQSLYGVNSSTNTGDDTYTFDYTDFTYKTIWDAGGTDTFDLSSNSGDTTLDLNGGSLNSVDEYSFDEIVAYFQNEVNFAFHNAWIESTIQTYYDTYNIYTGEDNIAIGTGVIIENVTTGSGDDTITDNEVDNIINTGLGDDIIHVGTGGYDTVDGGEGTDILSINLLQGDVTVIEYNGAYLMSNDSYGVAFDNIETIRFSDGSTSSPDLLV